MKPRLCVEAAGVQAQNSTKSKGSIMFVPKTIGCQPRVSTSKPGYRGTAKALALGIAVAMLPLPAPGGATEETLRRARRAISMSLASRPAASRSPGTRRRQGQAGS